MWCDLETPPMTPQSDGNDNDKRNVNVNYDNFNDNDNDNNNNNDNVNVNKNEMLEFENQELPPVLQQMIKEKQVSNFVVPGCFFFHCFFLVDLHTWVGCVCNQFQ